MRKRLFLAALSLCLAWCVLNYGGTVTPAWNECLTALAAICLAFWLTGKDAEFAPPARAPLLATAAFAPLYAALQLVPVPPGWLRSLSPGRAALTAAPMRFDPHQAWAPLSVAPAITFAHLLRMLACAAVFFLVRDLTWRFGKRPWTVAAPIVAIAAAEAALGLALHFGNRTAATGTYVNPNHFAGLLEMSLPFAALGALAAYRHTGSGTGGRPGETSRIGTVCLLLACAAAIFSALLYSFSRMGLTASLASAVVVVVGAALPGRRWTWATVTVGALAFAGIAALVVFAAPATLVDRLAGVTGPGDITSEGRLQFWRETIRLIHAYPIFGCGLGAYGSAIQLYRASAPLNLLDFAHNDYLQLTAELGFAGFLPLAAAGLSGFVWLARTAAEGRRETRRLLALACTASLLAIGLHGLVDFNFYIPANALLMAWVAGIASGLGIPDGPPANARFRRDRRTD